jgi:hypothetical protein
MYQQQVSGPQILYHYLMSLYVMGSRFFFQPFYHGFAHLFAVSGFEFVQPII